MSTRIIPRRFGAFASGFTQCRYLTTENSMPYSITVISTLAVCVYLIAVLKAQSLDFFKIQDLRGFDLAIYDIL